MVARSETLRHDPKQPFFDRKLLLLLLIGSIGLIFGIPKWKEVVRQNEDGDYELEDWREDERITELEKTDNAEQYRLVALVSGYYPCFFCKDKQAWINIGETLKIGITTVGTERYGLLWLKRNNVQYVVDVAGDLTTVRSAEIKKIADYPLWPENIKRPVEQRLVVPPFHRTVRLK